MIFKVFSRQRAFAQNIVRNLPRYVLNSAQTDQNINVQNGSIYEWKTTLRLNILKHAITMAKKTIKWILLDISEPDLSDEEGNGELDKDKAVGGNFLSYFSSLV